MKKLFIYMSLIVIFAACSKAPSYKITGEITNIDGTIYLTHNVDGNWINTDSATLVEGKFTFEGSVNGPEQYLLTFNKNKRVYIPFIIENSQINIVADIKNRANAQITGSASQDVMNVFKEMMKPFSEKSNALRKDYTEASKAEDKVKLDEITGEYEMMEEEKGLAILEFIENNNKSITAAIIASQQDNEEAVEIDELIALLDASLLETDVVVKMKEKADALRKVAIGKTAPDFIMNDPEGNPVTLSSLFGKGYLLVDFWASWCGPCRKENPHLVATYNKYHDKGFEILGVSYDNKKEKWLEAIEKDKLTWIHVSDLKKWDNLTKDMYCISGIPSNVLLDKEGRIIAKNLRGDALIEKIAELVDSYQ